MFILKLRTIAVLFIFASPAQASFKNFNKQNCINTSFDIRISHDAYPLGLTQNIIQVKKENCEIFVSHEKLKFIKKNWLVDVCRHPIHIKKKGRSIDVVKRKTSCNKNSIKKDNFCTEYFSIKDKLQDDGLIFAKGEKENLNTEHGKVYCAYSLLESYLAQGNVLSRYHKTQTNQEKPIETPTQPKKPAPTKKPPSLLGYPL